MVSPHNSRHRYAEQGVQRRGNARRQRIYPLTHVRRSFRPQSEGFLPRSRACSPGKVWGWCVSHRVVVCGRQRAGEENRGGGDHGRGQAPAGAVPVAGHFLPHGIHVFVRPDRRIRVARAPAAGGGVCKVGQRPARARCGRVELLQEFSDSSVIDVGLKQAFRDGGEADQEAAQGRQVSGSGDHFGGGLGAPVCAQDITGACSARPRRARRCLAPAGWIHPFRGGCSRTRSTRSCNGRRSVAWTPG